MTIGEKILELVVYGLAAALWLSMLPGCAPLHIAVVSFAAGYEASLALHEPLIVEDIKARDSETGEEILEEPGDEN